MPEGVLKLAFLSGADFTASLYFSAQSLWSCSSLRRASSLKSDVLDLAASLLDLRSLQYPSLRDDHSESRSEMRPMTLISAI
jgi:hypothetical protein